jgi:hypothetical protein
MSQPSGGNRLDWVEVAWLVVMGCVFCFGMVANRLSLVEATVTVAFAAALLAGAWLWQRLVQQVEAKNAEGSREMDAEEPSGTKADQQGLGERPN